MNLSRAEWLEDCRARLSGVRERIEGACARVGRDPTEVEVLAVTKGHSGEILEISRELGLWHVGENRVQDLLPKLDHLPPDLRVQFIGRLQTNKVNKLVGRVESIASVDRVELLEKIEARARECGLCQRIWIQVNISAESQKGGCAPDRVAQLWQRGLDSSALEAVGLLGMGARGVDEVELRRSFALLRSIGADLVSPSKVELSMGMSGDFEVAVEEGATQLRLGKALFGPRG